MLHQEVLDADELGVHFLGGLARHAMPAAFFLSLFAVAGAEEAEGRGGGGGGGDRGERDGVRATTEDCCIVKVREGV